MKKGRTACAGRLLSNESLSAGFPGGDITRLLSNEGGKVATDDPSVNFGYSIVSHRELAFFSILEVSGLLSV
jgi:hypothetical protein